MDRALRAAFVLPGVLALCTGTGYAAPGRAILNGIVTGTSGQPIDDATVFVYSAGVRTGYSLFCPTCYVDCGKRATTDRAGRFTIAGLDDELRFNLLVVKDGFAPAWIRTADPQKGEVVGTVLEPRQPIADLRRVLSGRIVDSQGQPVAAALIEPKAAYFSRDNLSVGIAPGTEPVSISNDQGEFEIAYGRPAKELAVQVLPRGRAPLLVTAPTGGQRTSITVSDGASIHGRLLKHGRPVGGVELGLSTVSRNSADYDEERIGTDSEGRFAFPNVPVGRVWNLYTKLESLTSRSGMFLRQCATERDGQNIDVGDIHLQQGLLLAGRVHLADGKSIADGMHLTVTWPADNDGAAIPVGSDGSFAISGLSPGAYVLYPSVRGYRLRDGDIAEVLVKPGMHEVEVMLEPDAPASH